MFGNNPIRKPLAGDGLQLEVKSVFPTLQGEGPHVGLPSVFVRLGGCNLACSFCDTDFENYTLMGLDNLVAQVQDFSAHEAKRVRHLVVITGGEPFRQNIAPLCQRLLDNGFMVQIETNGTLWRELPEEVEIICSPKYTAAGYGVTRPDLLPHITAFKFIISVHREGYNVVPGVGQSEYGTPVYVQPMDEGDEVLNAENTKRALELCQQYGYRMSIQTHKLLGIE